MPRAKRSEKGLLTPDTRGWVLSRPQAASFTSRSIDAKPGAGTAG
jgi:hypothetical protein